MDDDGNNDDNDDGEEKEKEGLKELMKKLEMPTIFLHLQTLIPLQSQSLQELH